VNATLLDLAHQCCDADAYLGLGYRCALTGSCYDELRPIGDAFWFSLPYRLATDESLLVYLQIALLAITAWIYAVLVHKAAAPEAGKLKKSAVGAVGLFILCAQIAPTFFNSLADTPATLLLVSGALLVLLGLFATTSAGLLFLAGGLLLGASTLLRAAYFNPVCLAGVLLIIFWLGRRRRAKGTQASVLLALGFTIPMSVQLYATAMNLHEWSFLSREQTSTQMDDHLKSAVTGYDTLLIESSYYWAPPCRPSRGVWNGLRERKADELYCLLSQRISFYFGSYAPLTYFGVEKNRNLVSNSFAEDIGHVDGWHLHNLEPSLRNTASPLGDMKASRLSPIGSPVDDKSFVETDSVIPLRAGNYLYSVWLWSAKGEPARALNITLMSKTLSTQTLDWQEHVVASQPVTISDQPTPFFLDARIAESGYLTARIDNASVDSSSAHQDFLAWGSMLEGAHTHHGYTRSQTPLFGHMGDKPSTSGVDRIFSPVLLAINFLLAILAFAILTRLYQSTHSPACVFIACVLLLIAAEALVILPEQRFVQGLLALSGMLGSLFFILPKSKVP